MGPGPPAEGQVVAELTVGKQPAFSNVGHAAVPFP